MTITEKILARESGASVVSPGDNIWVNAGILLTHDVCGPGTIGIFQREFGRDARVFDPERVVLLPDHYIFTADEKAHRNVDTLRAFVNEQGLPYFYDPGTANYCGVCHVALPELGHVRPGETIFGTDQFSPLMALGRELAGGGGNGDHQRRNPDQQQGYHLHVADHLDILEKTHRPQQQGQDGGQDKQNVKVLAPAQFLNDHVSEREDGIHASDSG